MRLRNLELKDASAMLEWMHDPEVVVKSRGIFGGKLGKHCIHWRCDRRTYMARNAVAAKGFCFMRGCI